MQDEMQSNALSQKSCRRFLPLNLNHSKSGTASSPDPLPHPTPGGLKILAIPLNTHQLASPCQLWDFD